MEQIINLCCITRGCMLAYSAVLILGEVDERESSFAKDFNYLD